MARKDLLAVTDFYGERLVVIKPGSSPRIDRIRGYLVTEHPEIQMKDIPQQYTLDVFNRCEGSGAVLLTLDGWKDVYPDPGC